MADEEKNEQTPEETPAAEAPEETPAPADEAPEETPAPADEAPEETPAPAPEAPEVVVEGDEVLTEEELEDEVEDADEDTPTPRVKPAIPGADLEVDIVREGEEALRGGSLYDEDAEDDGTGADEAEDFSQPIADAAIDLAADARYRATGKRKTAVARVTLKPGTGEYSINGRTLEVFFPRNALQRTIRQ